ncbi:hypothetical protein VNO78_19776 [Psophocarpus tetragonolobus]|uniref:Secreted protein n=1 Tax=Psophocarpus tetragonolobus TaxID=3891 RepID=A0AAN9S8P3_PSOTE
MVYATSLMQASWLARGRWLVHIACQVDGALLVDVACLASGCCLPGAQCLVHDAYLMHVACLVHVTYLAGTHDLTGARGLLEQLATAKLVKHRSTVTILHELFFLGTLIIPEKLSLNNVRKATCSRVSFDLSASSSDNNFR